MPDAVHRVLALVNDPNSTVAQLVEVLLTDQSLTAKILRLANSAFYGFVRKIETVTQACAVLGKNDIGDHVLSTAIHGFFGAQGPGLFDRRAFWEYNFAVAHCTRLLLRLSAHPAERVYVAALLRDIGQVVIDQEFPTEHDRILSLAQEKRWPVQRAEQEVLGFDHTLIGSMLAQRWNFPTSLVSVIRNHHSDADDLPAGSEERQLRTVIDLADGIVRAEGFGESYDHSAVPLTEEMWFPLGLNASHHERVTESLRAALQNLGGVFSA